MHRQQKLWVIKKDGKLDAEVKNRWKEFLRWTKAASYNCQSTGKQPEILIMDDSSSALDYATDAKLRQAIHNMPNRPTVFIVSQRAASIMYADKIIVLDDGTVAGTGTHEELLKDCSVYQEIYYSQFKEDGRRDTDMKKESRQKESLGRILKYMKKYWLFLGLSIALAVISVILTLYIPILTGDAIDYIVDKGKVDFTYITPILKKMVVVILITAVAQWIMNVCNNKMTYNIVRDIRKDAIRKIEILPLKYLDAHSYGEIVSRVIADVDQFADGLLMGFTQLFYRVVTIIGTLGFMLSVNVKITAVVVFLTPLSFVVAGFIAKKTFSMFKLQSETRGEQTALIDEMIGNQKLSRHFPMKMRRWKVLMKLMKDWKNIPFVPYSFPALPIRVPVLSMR